MRAIKEVQKNSFRGRRVLFLGMLFGLQGCSLYHESFSCPMGEGLRCTSVSHVNEAFNKKEEEAAANAPSLKEASLKKSFRGVSEISPLEETAPRPSLKKSSLRPHVMRTKEVILKVYIPPHEVKEKGEERSILMGDSYGYVVGASSRWAYDQKEEGARLTLEDPSLKKFLLGEEEKREDSLKNKQNKMPALLQEGEKDTSFEEKGPLGGAARESHGPGDFSEVLSRSDCSLSDCSRSDFSRSGSLSDGVLKGAGASGGAIHEGVYGKEGGPSDSSKKEDDGEGKGEEGR